MRSMMFDIQYVPSRQGVHLPQDSCLKKWTVLLTSQSIETVSSITITDADPRSPPTVRTLA
jgi:hypothetical protein